MISAFLRPATCLQRSLLTFRPSRNVCSVVTRSLQRKSRTPSGTVLLLHGNCPVSQFHTTSQRQAIWLANPYFYRITAFLTGRLLRRWWNKLPARTRKRYMSKLRNSENWILAGIFGMFGAGAGFYAYHLEEAPFSRRRRLMVIDREKMKEIGDYLFSIDMELYGDKILPANSAEHKRVHAVASRLLEANLCEEAKDINWTITILDDPIINAFVMPSGQIVVFTGMLELMKTDDMLAAILGHEMAHAIMGHMAENASREQFINFFSMIIVTLVWFILPDVTAFFTQWLEKMLFDVFMKLPYSRKLEAEADVVGLMFASRACYDIRESSVIWEALAKVEGETQQIEWLSTHPAHETRAAYLESIIPDFIEYRKTCNCCELKERDFQAFKKAVFHEVVAKKRQQQLQEV